MDGRSTSGVGPRGRSRNSATVQTAHCIPPWGAAPSRHRGDPTGRTDAELGLAAADVRCSVLGIPLPKPEGEAAQPGPPSGNPTLPSDYPTDKGLSAGKARGQTRPTRVAVPPTLCVAHPVPVRARRRAAPLPEGQRRPDWCGPSPRTYSGALASGTASFQRRVLPSPRTGSRRTELPWRGTRTERRSHPPIRVLRRSWTTMSALPRALNRSSRQRPSGPLCRPSAQPSSGSPGSGKPLAPSTRPAKPAGGPWHRT